MAVKITPFCPLSVKVTQIFPFYKYKPLKTGNEDNMNIHL
jgi:hypothetical protein